jgi:hypothetical protein
MYRIHAVYAQRGGGGYPTNWWRGTIQSQTVEVRVRDRNPKERSSVYVDSDYILALTAANRFLEAWRTRHQDNGIAAISGDAIREKGEQYWRNMISGISNPHHQAYEVGEGSRIDDRRFAFRVWLHELYTGEEHPGAPRDRGRVLVVREVGHGQWRVDEIERY